MRNICTAVKQYIVSKWNSVFLSSSEDKIDSGESEGMYNEFVSDRIEDKVEDIVTNGFDADGSEVIVELGDIESPTFVYGDNEDGQGGRGNQPGTDNEGLKFGITFDRFMQAIAKRFRLPNLIKEGNGKIKEISHEWKTFGPTGTILDKRRTFKRALKTSIATGIYDPDNDKYDVLIKRKDKRFKLPETVEKPKYKAVVMFIGDVSYSTYGKRLEQEKKYVAFIQAWINYNYGKRNVDYRFFVHEAKSYEVGESQFYNVANSGGTMASPAFEQVIDITHTEYDPSSTTKRQC
jgi:uncharacterized sporulation protein YeaH/YhbH (DUF444 family)